MCIQLTGYTKGCEDAEEMLLLESITAESKKNISNFTYVAYTFCF